VSVAMKKSPPVAG